MEYKQLDEVLKTFNDDLLKTRKQLQQLKESIDFALKQINFVDKLLKQKEVIPVVKNNESFVVPFSILKSLNENLSFSKCEKCHQYISEPRKEIQKSYKTSQPQCQLCKETYYESREHHEQYLCGQVKVSCQSCGLQVQRKLIDRHVKLCQFRNCFKCDKKVYLKSFAYHLKVCRKGDKRSLSSKKNIEKENIPLFKEKNCLF